MVSMALMGFLDYLLLDFPHMLPYLVGMLLTLLLWQRWPAFSSYTFTGILILFGFRVFL